MSGLPGSGKSTVAKRLASELGCAVISVDTIERGLREAGVDPEQPIGLAAYVVANRLADVQLGLGHTVIADAVNHHPDARRRPALFCSIRASASARRSCSLIAGPA